MGIFIYVFCDEVRCLERRADDPVGGWAAGVGGVSLRELALLEVEFLKRLEWRIVPKPETLVDYYKGLVERGQGYVLEKEPETAPVTADSTAVTASPEVSASKVENGELQR